jgi:DNA invertase Pin-like site-specific DNA recombinase
VTDSHRIAIYARVSTRDKNQDVENQLAQLREFARRQGWQVTAEYVDQASTKNGERSELQRMFRAASRREFDHLLFWSLDRLSREGVSRTLGYLEQLTAWGVGWRSYTEQYLDSCGIFRDAVISILATVAKQERVRISERVSAGLERARAKGKRLGRPQRSDITAGQIRELRGAGKSWRGIAKHLAMPLSTVVDVARRISP